MSEMLPIEETLMTKINMNLPLQENTLLASVRLPSSETMISLASAELPVAETLVSLTSAELPVAEEMITFNKTALPVKEEMVTLASFEIPVSETLVTISNKQLPVKETLVTLSNFKIAVREKLVGINHFKIPVEISSMSFLHKKYLIKESLVGIAEIKLPVKEKLVSIADFKIPLKERLVPLAHVKFPTRVKPTIVKFRLKEGIRIVKLPMTIAMPIYIDIGKAKLPIKETYQSAKLRLPIQEKVWILEGFVISENIIDWKSDEFILSEIVKSRLILNAEMIDKSHIKLKWLGDTVPAIEIYKKNARDADPYGEPEAVIEWETGEYVMQLDSNAYQIKVVGSNETGESDTITLGQHQEHDINVYMQLPINEKYTYIEVELTSVYRIEVNL